MDISPYLLSQIFGFIGFIIGVTAFQFKNQKLMFATGEISNSFWVFHYLLLGAYSGAICLTIAIVRTTIILFIKEEWKTPILITALVGVLAACFYSSESYWYKYLPFFCAFMYSLALFFHDNFLLSRVLTFITITLWLIYGILLLSFAEITESSLSMISIIIGIIRHRKHYQQHKPSI